MSNPLLGISLVVLSMLLYPATYAFFKASNPYLSNSLIVFFQSFFSWLIVLPIALRKGFKPLATPKLGMIAIRTLFGLTSMMLITFAMRRIALAEVVLLNNAAPLFVPIFIWLLYRTTITYKLWISLIVGFVGVLLVLHPGFGQMNLGLLFAFLSGISSALLLIATRHIAQESFFTIMFYYFLIFCLILSPSLFSDWTSPPPIIWFFLVLSSLTMLGAQICFTAGLRYVSSHEAAPFIYSSVVFSGFIDWAIWHETPNLLSIIGMVIVCIGASLAIIFTKRPSH